MNPEDAIKGTGIPYYLIGPCAGNVPVCYGCDDAVKQNLHTGRWFITMNHPGFNARGNNGRGYATKGAARAILNRYTATTRQRVAFYSGQSGH